MTAMYVGVDFGGSSLKAVAADAEGRVLRSHIAPAGGAMPRGDLVEVARDAIIRVSGGETVERVGFAFGGAIQPDGTMLAASTNLPNLAGVPLAQFFENELGRDVRIEHDARAAMRGEAWSGSARGARDAMAITFGTGIGAGLMLDRKIIGGAHGRAGEIGLWRLDGSGSNFEDSSAPGRVEAKIGKKFAAMFESGEASEMIARAGSAIANAHLLLDLEMAILIGGIAEIGDPLRTAFERAFELACPEDYRSGFEIKLGAHGALAGAVGAASLWREGTP